MVGGHRRRRIRIVADATSGGGIAAGAVHRMGRSHGKAEHGPPGGGAKLHHQSRRLATSRIGKTVQGGGGRRHDDGWLVGWVREWSAGVDTIQDEASECVCGRGVKLTMASFSGSDDRHGCGVTMATTRKSEPTLLLFDIKQRDSFSIISETMT